ncbi:hypothetical protein S2M10_02580 [Sphingomonas sp. S2M10]|uniref:hypothetical protein n=1 Tax=Sphingomonas sp. S2M10 TaxID=2705010 RepID=UPI00145644B1|nr:hypothetical protein [Sphingomonas sp. S2M10]NLS25295.1 hypothetical protein [Sphingomonas sp. S2M10]
MNPEPNAALIDAGMLVTVLFAARLVLLAWGGHAGWRGWAARWLRRGAAAGLLVPVLRLGTLAAAGGARTPLLIAALTALLAAGALLALIDAAVVEWCATPRRADRGPFRD